MSAVPSLPLREFSRERAPAPGGRPDRAVAGLLTGGLYAGLALLLVWWPFAHPPVPAATTDITAIVMPRAQKERVLEPPPVSHLVKPRAETAAPPAFTIASGAPQQAPMPLPASAAESPLLGGTSGNGTGQSASGTGTGGNGAGTGACIDAAWMQAVTERVRQFFYYPPAALAVRRTGLVMLHFTVRRDGQIDQLRISKSSGDAGLDKAALDIVQKAQPLPPITQRMHADRIEGDLPINFGVRNFSGNDTMGTC